MISMLLSGALMVAPGLALASDGERYADERPLAIPAPDQPHGPPERTRVVRQTVTRVPVQRVEPAPPPRVEEKPPFDLERADTLAVGVRWGSLYSGHYGGHSYADLGVGLAARYRPAASVGLEAAIQHHDQTWSARSARSQTLISGSVMLFAWSWTRVSPYAVAGLTWAARDVHHEVWHYDGVDSFHTRRPLAGPHAGLGLELALGRRVVLDLEARYVDYLNRRYDDPALPGALTTTAAVMIHL